MIAGTDLLIQAFRLWVTDNVPASGANWPNKAEIIAGLTRLEVDIGAAQAGLTTVSTIAARDTFYATPENQGKLVYVNNNNGSATDPANGVYEYVSSSARLAQGFYAGVASVVQPLVDRAETAAEDTETLFDNLGAAVSPPDANFKVAFLDSLLAVALGIKNTAGEVGHTYISRLSGDSDIAEAAENALGYRIMPTDVAIVETPEESGVAFGVKRGNYWIGFRNDGTITGPAAGADSNAFVRNKAGAYIPLVSGWDIVCHGDSMFGGAFGTPVTSLAAAMPDRIVTNKGVGGRSSTQIAARQGGYVTTLTVTGGTIPADGSAVACVPNIGILSTNATSGTATMPGTVLGVPCILTVTHGATDAADTYTVQRTSAGAAITAPAGTPFIPDDKATYAAHTALIWVGRNNATQITTVRDDILSMIEVLTPMFKRVLVIGVIPPSGYGRTAPDGGTVYNQYKALNDEIRRSVGEGNFVDMQDWMVTRALIEAGITPTGTDTTQMADGAIPASALGDGTHPVAAVNDKIGPFLARNLKARGY